MAAARIHSDPKHLGESVPVTARARIRRTMDTEPGPGSTQFNHFVGRTLRLAAVVVGLVLGAVAVTAWLVGETADELPIEYEGFD